MPKHLLALSALSVGLVLASCSGDVPTLAGASAANPGVGDGAALTLQAGTTPDVPGFNPFSERPATTSGQREVMQNPSVAEIMKPGELPEAALGRQDAPVTIVQYASLTCPYCHKFQVEVFPVFKREYIDTGKVRYILREFPIGKTSGAATIALRCAKPEKYLTLYGKFMEQQPDWVSQEVRLDPIYKVASQVGMTRQQFDACRENQAMISGLNWVKERGRKLGVIGTPNFFVGGKLVKKELSIEDIRAMVDPLVAARTTAAAGTPH